MRITSFGTTDGQRRLLHVRPVKPPKPIAPTVRKVAEIVRQKIVATIKRPQPVT